LDFYVGGGITISWISYLTLAYREFFVGLVWFDFFCMGVFCVFGLCVFFYSVFNIRFECVAFQSCSHDGTNTLNKSSSDVQIRLKPISQPAAATSAEQRLRRPDRPAERLATGQAKQINKRTTNIAQGRRQVHKVILALKNIFF